MSFAAAGEEFSHATSFPMPILLSAAFDDDLIHKVASVIGDEARAFGNGGRSGLDFWTPNINPYKDPRWGRGAEVGQSMPRLFPWIVTCCVFEAGRNVGDADRRG